MAKRLIATTQVDYAQPGTPSSRLIIEYDPVISFNLDTIRLRLYPNVPAKLAATIGSVAYGQMYGVKTVTHETVEFRFSDRATPKYPISRAFAWYPVNSDAGELMFDAKLNSISPAFHYDPVADQIIASEPCFGAIVVSYQSDYRTLDYFPQIDRFANGGMSVRTGTVIALYNDALETFDVDIGFNSKERDWLELYKVYSVTIKNRDGEWELPKNWPNDNSYPGIGIVGPDPDASVDQERIHELGLIRQDGWTDWRRNRIQLHQPYQNAANWRPVIHYERGQMQQGFEAAWDSVDWDSIEDRIKADYPGIKGL